MIKRWQFQVFGMELRKIITYRADFWVNFIGQTLFSLLLAYYLWSAIFESVGTDSLSGFTFKKIMLYYLLVPLIFRIQQGETIGAISQDIYEGGLSKYLLYPINYYTYKISTYLAHASFFIIQLFVLRFLFNLFFYQKGIDPPFFEFSLLNSFLFLIAIFACSLCYFFLNSLTELIAFWADNIWSLGLMTRWISAFLGGALIPLAFFPEWAQSALQYTPFPYLITFPVNILLNDITLGTFLENITILLFWILLFFGISKVLWSKGKYSYTGVGI